MRVRLVLAVGLALILGALVLDMSGRAPRLAGSDHTAQAQFVATLPPASKLCQPLMELPDDARRVSLLIGSYGKPLPALRASFVDGSRVLSRGSLAAGTHEGPVTVPMSKPPAGTDVGELCLSSGPGALIVIAGDVYGAGVDSVQVNGHPQPGRIAVTYLRGGSESWWQLLPTLSRRFGYGKAFFLGDWTLAAAALLLLGVWAASVRLLAREAR